MSKISIKDLDPRVQKQLQAAEQSLRTNPRYAAEIAQGVLSRHPECVDVRRLLRKGQKLAIVSSGGGALGKLFGGLFGGVNPAKDPAGAMAAAEKTLAKNPVDVSANKQLAAAAEKLGWFDTAAFAHEEIALAEPKNAAGYVAACRAYLQASDFDNALRVADTALKQIPGNGELHDLARRASVAKTMQQGQWEKEGDYKAKLKNDEEALALQKAGRVVQDAGDAASAIPVLEEKITADPENVDIYRELVKNYNIVGEYEKAIEALQRARKTNIGRADAALERQENDLIIANMKRKVEALSAQLQAAPDDAELRGRYESEKAAQDAFKLKNAATLVEKYPNDFGYRYELGVLLLAAGRNDEAIQQLQVAQRSPKNRHGAMLYLSRAFISGGKYDLAVDQLQTAKGEIQVMNDVKKELVYELGTALEKLGKVKEAVDEYKIIYMSDAAFRDVAKKINAFYEAKN